MKLALALLSRTRKDSGFDRRFGDKTFGKGMIPELRANARLVRDYSPIQPAMSIDRHVMSVRDRAKHLAIFKCER